MATEFIPFAQMTTAEKREHLVKAHGLSETDVTLIARNKLSVLHKDDHRAYDETDVLRVPHAHTKVARTKR
jgi:hypothetical protein